MKGTDKVRAAPGEVLLEMVSDRGSTPLASTKGEPDEHQCDYLYDR